MSDGDESRSKKGRLIGGADDFGRAVAKVAVAQICDSTGFHSSNHSALDALADVAIRYICSLGKAATFYANLANRTECNVFDVILGLEDLESPHGFAGASDVHRCLISSGVVKDITHFVSRTEEIPFARSIPRFPIVRPRKLTPRFAQSGETPGGSHIPEWLPAFPDPHTYIKTPVWNERETDLRAERIEQERQRRKSEKSLLSLQRRLCCNGAVGTAAAVDGDGEGKGKRVVESNPFLAPPLLYGEKDVSEIVVPRDDATEKKLSVLETFAPAIEAAKAGSLDGGLSERRMLPNKRPTVHFRLGIERKSMALPSALRDQGRSDSVFLRDGEKDDKKRRAEMILKEAMENVHELIQM